MSFQVAISTIKVKQVELMTELLDLTRANLPLEIQHPVELFTYVLLALLNKEKTYEGITLNTDLGIQLYNLSVNSPTKVIKVISLSGISRCVVIVDNTNNDDDIRTQFIKLDKYFNVGAFPVKRNALYRAFRSTESNEQESKLINLYDDLKQTLFYDVVEKPPLNKDVNNDNDDDKDVKSLLQSQRSSHAIATPTYQHSSSGRQQPPSFGIGSDDLNPFQSINNPPSGLGLPFGHDNDNDNVHGMYPTPQDILSTRKKSKFDNNIDDDYDDILKRPPQSRFDPIGPSLGRPGSSNRFQFSGDPDFDEAMPPNNVSN